MPGAEGYLGVLAHHAALVTALAPGVLKVRKARGAEEQLAVSGGFFEVSHNRATVLADRVGVANGQGTSAQAGDGRAWGASAPRPRVLGRVAAVDEVHPGWTKRSREDERSRR